MKANRAVGRCWVLRRDQFYPIVETAADDRITIYGGVVDGLEQYLNLPRKDARLLAKRINECLDATAVK